MATVAAVYPCHGERATTFQVAESGAPDMHDRKCPVCLQEYEIVTRWFDDKARIAECSWRPVTRLIGDVIAVTQAFA